MILLKNDGFLMEKVHTYDADASEKYVCPNTRLYIVLTAAEGTLRRAPRQPTARRTPTDQHTRRADHHLEGAVTFCCAFIASSSLKFRSQKNVD